MAKTICPITGRATLEVQDPPRSTEDRASLMPTLKAAGLHVFPNTDAFPKSADHQYVDMFHYVECKFHALDKVVIQTAKELAALAKHRGAQAIVIEQEAIAGRTEGRSYLLRASLYRLTDKEENTS